MAAEPPEGVVVGQISEEVETEAERETDQTSEETEEDSGAEEDHIVGFCLAEIKNRIKKFFPPFCTQLL